MKRLLRVTFLYLGVVSFLGALGTVFVNNLMISTIFLVAGSVFIIATAIMGFIDQREEKRVLTEETIINESKTGGAIR